VDELACEKQKIAFANKITTDGYATNFLFARKKATDKEVQSIQLEIQDFTASEIHEHFHSVAVDPGPNQIFTACYCSG
jgi:ribosomal protein L9